MQWINDKIVDPLLLIVQRGAEPKQLALSTALGLTLGIFPICGVTIFLCGIAVALLGSHCNAPSLMLANFIATPIELSLIIPFLRLGEFVSGGPSFPLTADALKRVLTGHASREILISVYHAILGWVVSAPFILLALYTLFLPIVKYLIRKYRTLPASPKKDVSPRADIKIKVRGI